MKKHEYVVRYAGVIVFLGMCGPFYAWAGQEDYPLYPSSDSQTTTQTSPGASSGNIIGYKPIPESALEVAISAGPSQAFPGGQATAVGQATGQEAWQAAGGSNGMVPSSQAAASLPTVYQTGVLGEGFYTLGRDDIIRIGVQNQPEFSGDFPIGFDGRIQYNYLGDIPIAGMTKYEVQQVLEHLLKKYVRVPVVNVMIVAYNSKVVYVIGEVNRPGKFIMRGDTIKLREAILAAGLPNNRAALQRVHVIKPDLERPKVRVINFKKILYKGKLKYDITLASGEIIVVPSTVLSKVNDFLAALLSPVTRASSFAALAAI